MGKSALDIFCVLGKWKVNGKSLESQWKVNGKASWSTQSVYTYKSV